MRIITFNHSGSPTFKIFKIKIFANVFYRWAKFAANCSTEKELQNLGFPTLGDRSALHSIC